LLKFSKCCADRPKIGADCVWGCTRPTPRYGRAGGVFADSDHNILCFTPGQNGRAFVTHAETPYLYSSNALLLIRIINIMLTLLRLRLACACESVAGVSQPPYEEQKGKGDAWYKSGRNTKRRKLEH